jgi:multiple sugar transport system substrate-binding protein
MARQKGEDYFIGDPRDILEGKCKDTYAQVMNSAFPGGLLSVADAIKMMNAACYKS